jgi:pyruvate/2-oxoglutarate dehydrogenase complex dihydrolipoamide acyltransferase (E2) component
MIARIALPKFDANITEATLGAWHVAEGEAVAEGDVLADVITDKANFEMTADAAGVLRKILAPEKSQVPLGYIVALVGGADEALPDVSAENAQLMAEYRQSVTGRVVSAPAQAASAAASDAPRRRVRATPRARRLAREHHIDLESIPAEGDMVTEKDVQAAIEEKHA